MRAKAKQLKEKREIEQKWLKDRQTEKETDKRLKKKQRV